MAIAVIGAGLAGCEAAWQIAKRNINVKLYEMKPEKFSPAHSLNTYAELVCSNSLGANSIENASGLLKEEMRLLDSLIMSCADAARIPAGGALAVDRHGFSNLITDKIRNNSYIEIINGEITKLPNDEIVIIATGPLTSNYFSKTIAEITGREHLHFYDAAAPIVTYDSIDKSKVFRASRYDKGEADYINCPMNEEEYDRFYEELIKGQTVEMKSFEKKKVFEGCMPVEIMASRGKNTLLFGPLKPVGLRHPVTKKEFHAVVQLRQDNKEGTLFNLVGFQTHLKWGEQKRIFSMIPGLENAEFVRFGVMHRNTYINSPELLDPTYNLKTNRKIFFAGQITGVEGYLESVSSGLIAGINAAKVLKGEEKIIFPKETALGSLADYIAVHVGDFQPMNINFGIIEPLDQRIKKKKEKKLMISQRALNNIVKITANLE
jgi:methylenetetrahydrofolate--tRNA-(uracil-5-)-methyltransferase